MRRMSLPLCLCAVLAASVPAFGQTEVDRLFQHLENAASLDTKQERALLDELDARLREHPDPTKLRKLKSVRCFRLAVLGVDLKGAEAAAAQISRELGDQRDDSSLRAKICEAVMAYRNGSNERAESLLRAIVDDPANAAFPGALGEALSNLGEVYQITGRTAQAFETLLRAHRAFQQEKPPGERAMLRLIERLAAIYGRMGASDKAIEYFELAIEQNRKFGNTYSGTAVLINLGRVYETLGKYDQAAEWFNRALAQATEHGNLELAAHARMALASVYTPLGKPEQALALLDQARQYFESVHSTTNLSVGRMWRGMALHALGRDAQALKELDEAMDGAQREKRDKSIMRIFEARAAIYEQQGHWERALKEQKAFQALSNKIAATNRAATDARLRVEFDVEKTEREKQLLAQSDAAKGRELEKAADLRRLQTAAIVFGLVALAVLGGLFLRLRRQAERVREQKSRAEGALARLQRAQEQLVMSEKMASIGTLTAGVAHEINNPANFAHVGAQALGTDIRRFRDFLLTLAGEGETEVRQALNARVDGLTEQVDTIVSGTTRIRDLVKDLRSFSRLDEAERKSVRVSEGLASTIRLIQPQFTQVARIECALTHDPLVDCWPALLNQVFMNVIVNACQAVQECRRREPGTVRVTDRIVGRWLEIDIEDDGCGMSAEAQARMFEPFYTTKGVGEGTGLGMSISFGIMQRHGGDISVRSVAGEGSCVTLRLSLEEALEAAA